jgi:hypothetical protein
MTTSPAICTGTEPIDPKDTNASQMATTHATVLLIKINARKAISILRLTRRIAKDDDAIAQEPDEEYHECDGANERHQWFVQPRKPAFSGSQYFGSQYL